jgi:hypothetical protein
LRNEPNPVFGHPLAAAAAILLALLFLPHAAAQPRIGDCPVFPSNNVWNVPIDKLPVSPNSQAMIATNGPTRGLHPDLDNVSSGIPFVIVPPDQATVPITFTYADESDSGPYPIPPSAPVENDADSHVLVIQSGTCKLYELYAAAKQPNGSWTGGSGAVFDLKSNRLRPDGWTSTDAAGLPIFPGLLRYDEVASGVINHALRLTVPSTRKAHVWPARHDASKLTDSSYPPMGQRFRLKAGYDISGFSPDVQVVLTALKKYGLILADNGSSWFITGAPDPRWNMDTITTLKKITGSDLEAVDASSLIVSTDSAQAKGAPLRTVVPYSPSPQFDFAFNTTIGLTLSGDVTSSTIASFDDGAVYTFLICQDQAGSHAFAWPANVSGGANIGLAPGSCTAQQLVSDGTRLYATSPGSVNP